MTEPFFDSWAGEYDRSRRQLIPCFDGFYHAAVEQLDAHPQAPISVLDIGAGTGLLSARILEHFPRALMTLQDSSAAMLVIAQERFKAHKEQVTYLQHDYRLELPSGPFDAVVSALSIHHLTETEKIDLFQTVYGVLGSNGIFVNADQVLGETPAEEKFFRESWLAEVRAAEVSEADLEAALERMKADKMSTLRTQLSYLRSVGFQDVRAVFQDKSFVVYRGRKTSQAKDP